MPSTLFIRPVHVYQLEESQYEWALYDVTGEQVKVGPKLSLEMIEQTLMQNGFDQVDVVALWPANACFATSVSLPGNQARYLQQALPFAVEEQVAQDIEQIHIVLGPKLKNGDFSVVNTDKSLFAAYYDVLNSNDESELSLKDIVCDADLIPSNSEDMVVVLGDQQVLIKSSGDYLYTSTHEENLIPFLDSLFLGSPEGESGGELFDLKVIVPPNKSDEFQMLCAQLDQYPNVNTIIEQTSLSEFELLCENYFANKPALISLCQGEFQVANQSSGSWHKWRAVASIAALGFILQLGIFIGQGYYYSQQADVVGKQAVASYKKVVPNSSRVSLQKLPRIIKGKINQSKTTTNAETGFLDLLGEAGFQFNKNKFKRQMKFKTISYNQTRGELVMEMQAGSFDQLESLKKAIVAAGFSAKISSAVQEKDYFRGRISVGGV